jgi:hypothetical protein
MADEPASDLVAVWLPRRDVEWLADRTRFAGWLDVTASVEAAAARALLPDDSTPAADTWPRSTCEDCGEPIAMEPYGFWFHVDTAPQDVHGARPPAATPELQEPAEPCPCSSCDTSEWPGMIVCPTCGNKRCPKATHHDNACTGSNESGQPGSAYGNISPAAAGLQEAEPAARLTKDPTPVDLLPGQHLTVGTIGDPQAEEAEPSPSEQLCPCGHPWSEHGPAWGVSAGCGLCRCGSIPPRAVFDRGEQQ